MKLISCGNESCTETDHLCNKIFDNCLHIFEEEYQLRLQFDEELCKKLQFSKILNM
uniref:Uncharacterized protein n=1 Tax=Romanomermis culicivorax TaxID=13658 RepID=A0A915KX13_ROMCU